MFCLLFELKISFIIILIYLIIFYYYFKDIKILKFLVWIIFFLYFFLSNYWIYKYLLLKLKRK